MPIFCQFKIGYKITTNFWNVQIYLHFSSLCLAEYPTFVHFQRFYPGLNIVHCQECYSVFYEEWIFLSFPLSKICIFQIFFVPLHQYLVSSHKKPRIPVISRPATESYWVIIAWLLCDYCVIRTKFTTLETRESRCNRRVMAPRLDRAPLIRGALFLALFLAYIRKKQ